ncbi:hypothetical protein [Marinomonas transparens]|uniref:Lipoprotein n=1 Tax=Marinomonas transparens TaxID=2795388 RepID=A0A934JNW9_9GAMM|nr:hypothetical protein [Marinomonas transparens]MBJ7537419.1 hypothetical protein [Marinomonas transparens]
MKKISVLLIFIAITACTTQGAYDVIQANQKHTCNEYRGQQRDDCLDSFSQSYEQYSENREAYD